MWGSDMSLHSTVLASQGNTEHVKSRWQWVLKWVTPYIKWVCFQLHQHKPGAGPSQRKGPEALLLPQLRRERSRQQSSSAPRETGWKRAGASAHCHVLMFKDTGRACRAAWHGCSTLPLGRTRCVTQAQPWSLKGQDKRKRVKHPHLRNSKRRASSLWEFCPLTPLHFCGSWHLNTSESLALIYLHHRDAGAELGDQPRWWIPVQCLPFNSTFSSRVFKDATHTKWHKWS